MKKQMITATLSLLVSLNALAGSPAKTVNCVELALNGKTTPKSTLTVTETSDTQATVTLTNEQGVLTLEGGYRLLEETFFGRVFHYDLVDPSGAKSLLTISWSRSFGRGGCGRAGCLPTAPLDIRAILTIADKELDYTCHVALN